MCSLDGVPCVCKVLLGEAFEGILRAGDEVNADLIVMGAHRRQILRDIITGTTIERVIRQGRRPVLMANAVPAGNYHNILVAVDLSSPSAHAARTAQSLGVLAGAAVTALHAFEVPAAAMMTRVDMTRDQIAGHVAEEATQAKKALAQFMVDEGLEASRSIVRQINAAIHHEILACVREESAQLIVVGTHGRSGFAKLMLGSVAQSILQTAEQDVLAVPPSAES
jgi:nucleotide-binding universal stress UspA family protein